MRLSHDSPQMDGLRCGDRAFHALHPLAPRRLVVARIRWWKSFRFLQVCFKKWTRAPFAGRRLWKIQMGNAWSCEDSIAPKRWLNCYFSVWKRYKCSDQKQTCGGYLVKYRNVLSMAWRHIWVCVSAHSTFEYIWVVWNHPDYPMAIPHLYARKLSWPSTLRDSTVWELMISRGKQRSTCGLWN